MTIKNKPVLCTIDECEKKNKSKGLCSHHYERVRVHGDPHFTLKPRNEENPTYGAMHQRIIRERGKAKEYSCFINIDHPARDWAFIKETAAKEDLITQSVRQTYHDEDLLIEYSTNTLDYKPLCKPHHVKMDRYGWSLWDMMEDHNA